MMKQFCHISLKQCFFPLARHFTRVDLARRLFILTKYRFINGGGGGSKRRARQPEHEYVSGVEGEEEVFIYSFVISTQFPLNNVSIWVDNNIHKLSYKYGADLCGRSDQEQTWTDRHEYANTSQHSS